MVAFTISMYGLSLGIEHSTPWPGCAALRKRFLFVRLDSTPLTYRLPGVSTTGWELTTHNQLSTIHLISCLNASGVARFRSISLRPLARQVVSSLPSAMSTLEEELDYSAYSSDEPNLDKSERGVRHRYIHSGKLKLCGTRVDTDAVQRWLNVCQDTHGLCCTE